MTIKKGFTLIELLVAISIIGILSSFLLANFIGVRQRARDGVRKSDLRQIQSALELYRADKGSYPTADLFPACGNQFNDTASPPIVYMKKIPCDPSTSASYTYTLAGSGYNLLACLENSNDSQLDKDTGTPPQPIKCSGSTTTWKYTLQNP